MKPESAASLQAQQHMLLQALFAQPGSEAAQRSHSALDPALAHSGAVLARGLMAYTANAHALAERSLRGVYPVIAAMLGAENFSPLSRELWHRHPPQWGDLARWGGALPALLAGNPQLQEAPYLADVARVEWALHQAAGEADTDAQLASFARLTEEDPAGLTLLLAPGTALVSSHYPVASLVLAHSADAPSLAEAAQRLREGVHETALVWRQGLRPRVAPCSRQEAALLGRLLAGDDLPQALDAALACTPAGAQPFDFSGWLTQAVGTGLVLGVRDQPNKPLPHPPSVEGDPA